MKKTIFIAIPFLVLFGVLLSLTLSGIINIPGLTPPAKPKSAAKSAKSTAPPVASTNPVTNPNPPPVSGAANSKAVATPPAALDWDTGAKKIAAIWGEMQPADLVKIIPTYSNPQLAKIFSKMDPSQVGEILALLPPGKAASMSKEIEQEAALPSVPKSQS